MKKALLFIIFLTLLITGCANSQDDLVNADFPIYENESATLGQELDSNFIDVKYRQDKVNIGDERFEELNTSKSSFIMGAWYDKDNDYMVINLEGTYYHYCGMPSSTWSSFKRADSFGTYYNKYIKRSYDCRNNSVPNY